jgi:tetratricopeptide (TPR) repeat protein
MEAQCTQQDLFDFSSTQTAEAMRFPLLGEREEAEKAFEKLLQKDPDNYFTSSESKSTPEARLRRGVLQDGGVLLTHGQLEKRAWRVFDDPEDAGAGNTMSSYFAGLINQFLGNDVEAEEGFRVLRGSSRESLIANYYLAQLKIKHHRYQEALDLLEELLAAMPNLLEVHFQKGVVFMGMHRNMDAIRCFRKALELKREDKRAQGNLELLTEVLGLWPGTAAPSAGMCERRVME